MASLLDGVGIVESVAQLDRLARWLPGARGTTICLGVLDRRSGEFSYLCRAHPPPLVVNGLGATRVLPVRPAVPLGFSTHTPDVERAQLRPGDNVVLYTDGLIERPGATLSTGIEALSRAASDAVRRPRPEWAAHTAPYRLCAGLLPLVPLDHADDVTVMAAELRPDDLELAVTVPALPAMFADVRRRLREWLHAIDPSGHEHWAIELGAGEAVTNALDWAYPDHAGTITVTGSLDDNGRVRITVSDQGRWRPPDAEPGDRGRGLSMMRAFMDSVTIERDEHGTRIVMERPLGQPVHFDDRSSPAPPVPPTQTDLWVKVIRSEQPLLVAGGAIDFGTIEQFRLALTDASRGGALPLTVDLSEVRVLGSGGVQALTELANGDKGDHRLRLVAPPGSVAREILAMTGLDQLAQVLDRASTPRTSSDEPD